MRPDRLVAAFLVLYGVGVWLGSHLINFNPMHFSTIALVFASALSLFCGTYTGFRSKFTVNFGLLSLDFGFILPIAAVVMSIAMAFSWYYLIQKNGSLAYMFAHAMDVRSKGIGGSEDVIPIWITYPSSLVHAGFALSIVPGVFKKRWKMIVMALWFFILIALTDLQSFGRIAMLNAIFVCIGMYLLCNRQLFTKRTLKLTIVLVFLYFALMLPRMIRGGFDNFESSISKYKPYVSVELPSELNGLLSIYIYYFSSVYALDEFMQSDVDLKTNGGRTLTPIVNAGARIFDYDRINTIDQEAYIPFSYNIYTAIHDYWLDFGLAGAVGIPFVFGFIFGLFGAQTGAVFRGLQGLTCGWLFYLPLYNVFSFGQFLIATVGLAGIAMVCRNKSSEEGICPLT